MDRVEKLRQVRVREQLSYERLARLVDVSFMSLYRWIKVGIPPRNRSTIEKVDRFLAGRAITRSPNARVKKNTARSASLGSGTQQTKKGRRYAGFSVSGA